MKSRLAGATMKKDAHAFCRTRPRRNGSHPGCHRSSIAFPNYGRSKFAEPPTQIERLAYSIQEAADLLGVNYFSVYRLVQRGKLKVCRALRGKLLVPRSELHRLLKTE